MFKFLLTMYMRGRIDKEYLEKVVAIGFITEKDMELILEAPQA